MPTCKPTHTTNDRTADTLDQILALIDAALELARSLDRNHCSHHAAGIEAGLVNARFAADAEYGVTQKAIREESTDADHGGADKPHDLEQDQRFFRGIEEGEDWRK